jgi:hypothetical protein
LIIVECFPDRSSPRATILEVRVRERSSNFYEAASPLL